WLEKIRWTATPSAPRRRSNLRPRGSSFRGRRSLDEQGSDDANHHTESNEYPGRGVGLGPAGVDHYQHAENFSRKGGDEIAGPVNEAHGLAINLRRKNFGRHREKRSPGHVGKETHPAKRQGQN